MRIVIVLILTIVLLKTPVLSQDIECNYPIHISADSLMKILIHDKKKPRMINGRIQDGLPYNYDHKSYMHGCPFCDDMKKDFDKKNIYPLEFDSAIWKCQDYLIEHLGMSVYCKYIMLSLNGIDPPTPGGTALIFTLQWFKDYWDYPIFPFILKLQEDSTIEITYPKNVPDLKGLSDSGFVHTQQEAIRIAKKSGFINDSSKYYIKPNGLTWEIDSAESKYGELKSIKINIFNGKPSKVEVGYRID